MNCSCLIAQVPSSLLCTAEVPTVHVLIQRTLRHQTIYGGVRVLLTLVLLFQPTLSVAEPEPKLDQCLEPFQSKVSMVSDMLNGMIKYEKPAPIHPIPELNGSSQRFSSVAFERLPHPRHPQYFGDSEGKLWRYCAGNEPTRLIVEEASASESHGNGDEKAVQESKRTTPPSLELETYSDVQVLAATEGGTALAWASGSQLSVAVLKNPSFLQWKQLSHTVVTQQPLSYVHALNFVSSRCLAVGTDQGLFMLNLQKQEWANVRTVAGIRALVSVPLADGQTSRLLSGTRYAGVLAGSVSRDTCSFQEDPPSAVLKNIPGVSKMLAASEQRPASEQTSEETSAQVASITHVWITTQAGDVQVLKDVSVPTLGSLQKPEDFWRANLPIGLLAVSRILLSSEHVWISRGQQVIAVDRKTGQTVDVWGPEPSGFSSNLTWLASEQGPLYLGSGQVSLRIYYWRQWSPHIWGIMALLVIAAFILGSRVVRRAKRMNQATSSQLKGATSLHS